MIEIAGLTKRYGRRRVLHDLDLSVASGSAVALWGPNGAGKTTVMLCTVGLVPYRGRIAVDGRDVATAGHESRTRLGYVPQQPDFHDDLTAAEVLRLSASLRRLTPRVVDPALEAVGLSAHGGVAAAALSGGMRRRLSLAVAMLHDPPVLLLDEPLSNLDAASRSAMVTAVRGMRRRGRTIVIGSHHLDDVALLTDRVVLMEDGRISGECRAAELEERLGLPGWLDIPLPPDAIPGAVTTLQGMGLDPEVGGSGLLVSLPATRRQAALSALRAAGIDVAGTGVWR